MRIPLCAWLLALSVSAVTAPAAAQLPAVDSQGEELPTLAPMIQEVRPAVVNIFTRTRIPQRQHPLFSDPFFRRFFDIPEQPRERYSRSLGSGVIVDAENGYVLTNHHVVDRAVEISVHLSDGRVVEAEIVGSDPETDVAVIKVAADDLSELPVGDTRDLRVGDFVIAVGNPFGLGQTVTSGIVSALGRSGLGIEGYEDFIQTDASINPGNSGGALVNLRGELVGINTAIFSQSGGNIGIGFAIPINMAHGVMQQLIEHGEVQRGQLGVQAQDLTPDLAQAFDLEERGGAVIAHVEPGSPAAKAGLQAGDVITAINGRRMKDAMDVRNAVGLLRVGETVELTIRRGGKSRTVEATIKPTRAAKVKGERFNVRLGGSTLTNITPDMPMHGEIDGVFVAEVARGSRAWRAGLRDGDIITQANRQRITNLRELEQVIKGAEALLLNIRRRGGALFLLIR